MSALVVRTSRTRPSLPWAPRNYVWTMVSGINLEIVSALRNSTALSALQLCSYNTDNFAKQGEMP
jgi:hypothetical protein